VSFLKRSKQNLLIKSNQKVVPHTQDFCPNLLTTICAILDIKIENKGVEFDADNFSYYIFGINFNRDDDDLIVIDQVSTIKSLINRPRYWFTEE
jgi:hypothetical protein